MSKERDELRAKIARLRDLANALDDPETAQRLSAHIITLKLELQKPK